MKKRSFGVQILMQNARSRILIFIIMWRVELDCMKQLICSNCLICRNYHSNQGSVMYD